ncbi:hypothetical protein CXB36_09450 [Pseudomonas syringae pv. syringae]|nr:hypothetical protein BKC06_013265 [Pseudomonas syringae pv. syringae]MCF5184202.1 hypothetical protein [Pseudomonas syringae]MCF5315658.1 hypothetical protein [Pseudomonas syringae]MCF5364914.1 hypothetical protein [Pseudomonas syringae]MCF5388308.1 hypothetical protein [Pseudomonas syringae]
MWTIKSVKKRFCCNTGKKNRLTSRENVKKSSKDESSNPTVCLATAIQQTAVRSTSRTLKNRVSPRNSSALVVGIERAIFRF